MKASTISGAINSAEPTGVNSIGVFSIPPPLQNLTPSDFFKDEKELVRLLEIFHQLNDVLVTLTMMKSIYFFEDPGSAVSRDLVYDLDCVLHVSVHVHTALYTRVRPLTQHFARQSV